MTEELRMEEVNRKVDKIVEYADSLLVDGLMFNDFQVSISEFAKKEGFPNLIARTLADYPHLKPLLQKIVTSVILKGEKI